MAVSDGTILKIVASILMPDAVLVMNVFNAVFADTGTSNDEADVVSDLVDWVEALYATLNAQISSSSVASEVAVYEYDAIDDDWDEIGSDGWTDGFTNTDQILPFGVAPIVRMKTIDPDVQGRKFLPSWCEDTLANGYLGAGDLTAAANFAAEWITAFVGAATGGDFVPVVWSPTGKVPKVGNGVYIVNAISGYQRRRKQGVGI